MLAHTLRYDAKCGMANQNVATTRTAAMTARAILCPRRLPFAAGTSGSARSGGSSVSWMASPAGDQVIGQQQHNSADDRGDPGGEVEEALQRMNVEQFGGEPAARQRTDNADHAGDD